jgi:hypothetical protein
MKIVNLIGPAVIAGAVRYPIENPLTVTDEQAVQLKDSGRLDGEPEDPDGEEGKEVDLSKLKIEELRALAANEGIELGDARSKADIITAIELAREGE